MEGQAAPGDGQDMSKATLRRASGTFRTFLEDAKSGNVRAVGRGDHAAHHSTADLGVTARAAGGFGLDYPPGAAIGRQGCEHRVVELVAAAHRPIGAE